MIKRTCTLKLCLLLFAFALALASPKVNAQDISIRTNLAVDALAEPNLGLEWKTGEHWSIGLDGGLKPWPRWLAWDWDASNETHWRNFYVSPEVRYYARQVFQGFFVGGDALYTHFNVGRVQTPFSIYPDVEDHRLQGDFLGLGLAAGYSWWLGKSNWRMEVEAGALAGYVGASKYECQTCGAKVGEAPQAAIVPKLAVNLAYTFRKKSQPLVEVLPPMPDTLAPPVPVPMPEPFQMELPPVEEWKGVAGELAPKHPVLRPSSEYIPYTPDRILRKEEGALYVFFELDRSNLRRSFTEKTGTRDNGPVLDEIIHITGSILADTTSSVSCIQIIGLASIEGRQDRNAALSLKRAKALQSYIQEALDVPDTVFETIGGGEAWTEFRDQIHDLIAAGGGAALTVEQLEKVIAVMDAEPNPDRREWRIKQLEGGAIFRQLSKHILSEQRNSGYIRVYFDYVPDENAKTINEAIEALEAGQPEKAMELLESVKEDSRSRAARTSTLLALGREEEAVVLLEAAAREGNEKAKAYLRAYEKHQREEKKYKAYLQELNEYNKQSMNH